jgi:hypothetical protein
MHVDRDRRAARRHEAPAYLAKKTPTRYKASVAAHISSATNSIGKSNRDSIEASHVEF